jgi:arsenate reductase-like glutaredoxin family protein
MIIDMSKLSKEELGEILSKAIDQISKLVDENNKLKEKLNGTKDL